MNTTVKRKTPSNNKYNMLLNYIIFRQHIHKKGYIREKSVWVRARREDFKKEANTLNHDREKERNIR